MSDDKNIDEQSLSNADVKNASDQEKGWQAFLRTRRRIRGITLLVLLFLIPTLTVALASFCWLDWLPRLWSWGFEPTSWKGLFSVFGALYLIIIPFVPLGITIDPINSILHMYARESDERIRLQIDEAMVGHDELEKRLQSEDNHGLIKLVRYSRLQLQAYYGIGLTQTQRSFRYSIIAMWIGFFVIIAGIISYYIPHYSNTSTSVNSFVLKYINMRANFIPAQQFALLGGLIIEIISAAFLWVYKSTITQLMYFFDKQQINLNALLAFSISETMTDKDAAKLKIIDRVLFQKNNFQVPRFKSTKNEI